MSFTWEQGYGWSITYDGDGIRTGKTVAGVTTSYFLDGSTILAQKVGSDVLWFLYDSDGARVGFTYNGTAYYYTQNAQGDVTGIVDSSCNTVVEYSYDAWGKLLGTTGSLASTIGAANPFRYRGYYYDTETGLYYLQSRYYDPQTGRFLNADEQIDPSNNIMGTNLFVYCINSPTNMVDPDGRSAVAAAGIYFVPGFGQIALVATAVVLSAVLIYLVYHFSVRLIAQIQTISRADAKIRTTVKRSSRLEGYH